MSEGRIGDIVGLMVTRRSEGGSAVFTVSGELDLETAPRLRHLLHDAIEEGAGVLVVDVHDLTFLDSTGISVLVDAYKQVGRSGGRLTLRSPSPPVRRVLEITGLLELFGLAGPAR